MSSESLNNYTCYISNSFNCNFFPPPVDPLTEKDKDDDHLLSSSPGKSKMAPPIVKPKPQRSDSAKSVEKIPSLEKKLSIEKTPSLEKKPSIEKAPSFEKTPSVEKSEKESEKEVHRERD